MNGSSCYDWLNKCHVVPGHYCCLMSWQRILIMLYLVRTACSCHDWLSSSWCTLSWMVVPLMTDWSSPSWIWPWLLFPVRNILPWFSCHVTSVVFCKWFLLIFHVITKFPAITSILFLDYVSFFRRIGILALIGDLLLQRLYRLFSSIHPFVIMLRGPRLSTQSTYVAPASGLFLTCRGEKYVQY
jgi:hypothetical protein